jgi:hypothetical protein
MMTVKQQSELQQAIDKLKEAQDLVYKALGDTDAGNMTVQNIEETIEDLEADLEFMFG